MKKTEVELDNGDILFMPDEKPFKNLNIRTFEDLRGYVNTEPQRVTAVCNCGPYEELVYNNKVVLGKCDWCGAKYQTTVIH